MRICACGCGSAVTVGSANRKYIPGHYVPTPEQIERQRQRMRGHSVSAETRRKISENHKSKGVRPLSPKRARGLVRERSATWKGGRTTLQGYACVYRPDHPDSMPNGYIYEHRLVAETMLGRRLLPTEVVHHKDHDRKNNVPENLQVFPSISDHMKHHATARRAARGETEGLAIV